MTRIATWIIYGLYLLLWFSLWKATGSAWAVVSLFAATTLLAVCYFGYIGLQAARITADAQKRSEDLAAMRDVVGKLQVLKAAIESAARISPPHEGEPKH